MPNADIFLNPLPASKLTGQISEYSQTKLPFSMLSKSKSFPWNNEDPQKLKMKFDYSSPTSNFLTETMEADGESNHCERDPDSMQDLLGI